MSRGVRLARMNKTMPSQSPKIAADKVLEHLDVVCKSAVFLSSKRCQQFLRYVVLETVEGRGDQIKERNIAHEVFGKGINFEPGEYSLVRVKAGEVRKRLTDFYQSTADTGLRIELPVGGYLPRIHYPDEPIESGQAPDKAIVRAKLFNRRRFAWMAGSTLAAVGATSLVPLLRHKATPLELLWRPVFATKEPLLIFIPVMREHDGRLTEWVGIGPASSLRRAADFLTEHHYPYHLRFGAELTFSQLREQPSLLLGGFDVDWTRWMTRDLRFAPLVSSDPSKRAIIDRQTKQTWSPVKQEASQYVDVDYGILCRLFDVASGQIVFLAVGTQTFGTEGAASLLFDPELFASLLKQAPSYWETKNFQAIIRVSVIGTATSSPQLVATHFW